MSWRAHCSELFYNTFQLNRRKGTKGSQAKNKSVGLINPQSAKGSVDSHKYASRYEGIQGCVLLSSCSYVCMYVQEST